MNDKIPGVSLVDFFAEPGDVAIVNPDDLRKIWAFMRQVPKREGVGISAELYKQVCSPDADVAAVWYRASMLGLLEMIPEKPLAPWWRDGALDEAVLEVAAKFPMQKLPVGIVRNGLPFDVSEFVKMIGQQGGRDA